MLSSAKLYNICESVDHLLIVHREATMAEHSGDLPPFLPTLTPGTEVGFQLPCHTFLHSFSPTPHSISYCATNHHASQLFPPTFSFLVLFPFLCDASGFCRGDKARLSSASSCTAQPPSDHSDLCYAEVACKSPAHFHRVRISFLIPESQLRHDHCWILWYFITFPPSLSVK